jgi:hypothetical protein
VKFEAKKIFQREFDATHTGRNIFMALLQNPNLLPETTLFLSSQEY